MEDKEKKSFYRRGSGMKVIICHEDDEQANYLVQMNRAAGNTVHIDDRGFLFVVVLQYNMAMGSN
jgi:hypothetical protein